MKFHQPIFAYFSLRLRSQENTPIFSPTRHTISLSLFLSISRTRIIALHPINMDLINL